MNGARRDRREDRRQQLEVDAAIAGIPNAGDVARRGREARPVYAQAWADRLTPAINDALKSIACGAKGTVTAEATASMYTVRACTSEVSVTVQDSCDEGALLAALQARYGPKGYRVRNLPASGRGHYFFTISTGE